MPSPDYAGCVCNECHITNTFTILQSFAYLRLFHLKLIDYDLTLELIVRFFFNLFVVLVIVRLLYFNIHKRKDYSFAYTLIGTISFLLCYLLSNIELQLGFALGLFVVFSLIRYRTNLVTIKEMTYLFVVIAVSVINSLTKKDISYAEILFTNIAIIAVAFSLEKIWLLKHESIKTIIYENIELIKPDKRQELIEDLEKRTGLQIHKVEVGRIDFLKMLPVLEFIIMILAMISTRQMPMNIIITTKQKIKYFCHSK